MLACHVCEASSIFKKFVIQVVYASRDIYRKNHQPLKMRAYCTSKLTIFVVVQIG